MKNQQQLITSEAREINPKAVFYGPSNELVTKLALYLTRWNVELFAGKELADAFYGDYFFYIGESAQIDSWLKKKNRTLPKTLLLLTNEKIDDEIKTTIESLNTVKAVIIHDKQIFSDSDIENTMSFFMGSQDKFLEFPHSPILNKQPENTKIKAKDNSETTRETSENITTVNDLNNNNTGQFEAVTNSIKATENKNEGNAKKEPVEAENTLEDLFHARPKESGGNTHNIKKRLNIKVKFPVVNLAIGIIFLLVILPIFVFIISGIISGINFYQAKNNFNQAKYSQSISNLNQAQTFLGLCQKSLNFNSWLFTVFHITNLKNTITGTVDFSWNLTYGLTDLIKVVSDGQKTYQSVISEKDTDDLIQLISAMKGNLVLANSYLSVAEAESKTDSVNGFLSRLNLPLIGDLSKTTKYLSDFRQNTQFATNALSIITEIIGVSREKNYLIIFQNNMELRPTGGFIGSYGLVKFINGKLKDFSISDIYTADGALQGHVDPPDPIKTYLHQEHWYMRDANWDPDFTKAAPQLIWFLEKEIDVKVDGVIAIDLQLAKELLNIIGPVKLTDYNETISADNIFTMANKYITTNNFPGSTQKKDFLSSLARVMQEKLITNKNITGLDILKLMQQAISEKHLLVYFNDSNIQQPVAEWGWSGQVNISQICPQSLCQPDFLQIVDANLGVNKSNFYVKRTIEDNVSFSEKDIAHNLSIKYVNNSTLQASGEGNYRNYLRIRIPPQSQLTECRTDSLPIKITNARLASDSAAAQSTEANFKEISILLDVPAQTTKILTLNYNQTPENFNNPFIYTYKIFKQPGTLADGLSVNLNLPVNWQVLELNPVLADKEKFTYNTDLSQDKTFEVKYNR